jgi:NADH dehydrogenase (ubiquinone) 1 alpha subcomplex subunit 9
VHVDGARRIARIAREAGVGKFVHVSALNASETSKSEFLRTKWLGEQVVLEEFPDATIVRPGAIYGHEDWFFRMMGFFTKHIGFVPLIDGGKNKIRPVFVVSSN